MSDKAVTGAVVSGEASGALRGAGRWAGVGALALALAAASGCHRKDSDAATPDVSRASEARAPVPAKFQRVTVKSLPQTLEVSGTIAADETSEVATQVAGVIAQVNVDVGTRVKKGDVLAQLDAREASLRSAQARATQEQAVARLGPGLLQGGKLDPEKVPDVRASKEAMDLAVSDADRTKALFDTGAVSQAQWDSARARAEQARAQYDAAQAGAKQSWATLVGAQAATGLAGKSVADTSVKAPFDGQISEKRVSPGEWAQVGRVVAVVVHDNPLRLKMDVAEVDIGNVQVGSKVDVLVAAYPNRVFPAVIKRVGAALRTSSRSLPVEAELDNSNGALKPGMFAKARMALPGGPTKAVMVPEAALGNTGQTFRVFVKNGSKVEERLVVAGRRDGALVEVIGAMGDADEVAVTSVDKLADGAEVTAQP